jgi:hypothetical protein
VGDRKISLKQAADETASSSAVTGMKKTASTPVSSALQKKKRQSAAPRAESSARPEPAKQPTYMQSKQVRGSSDQASSGSTSPTTGPLVVNGATGLNGRRGSQDEKSLGDDSSDDETDESETSDDESEDDDDGDRAGEC